MWFLTKVWIPFWILVALEAYAQSSHKPNDQIASTGIFMFGYGAVAFIITIVYACTKAFRAASRGSGAPR